MLADSMVFTVQFSNECAGGEHTGCEEGCVVEGSCES
jgi:hypothetical protein